MCAAAGPLEPEVARRVAAGSECVKLARTSCSPSSLPSSSQVSCSAVLSCKQYTVGTRDIISRGETASNPLLPLHHATQHSCLPASSLHCVSVYLARMLCLCSCAVVSAPLQSKLACMSMVGHSWRWPQASEIPLQLTAIVQGACSDAVAGLCHTSCDTFSSTQLTGGGPYNSSATICRCAVFCCSDNCVWVLDGSSWSKICRTSGALAHVEHLSCLGSMAAAVLFHSALPA